MDDELELILLIKEAEISLTEQLILAMIVDYLNNIKDATIDEINIMLKYLEKEEEYEICTKIINKQNDINKK